MANQAVLELVIRLKDEAAAGLEGFRSSLAGLGGPALAAGGVAAGAVFAVGAAAFDTATQVDNAQAAIQDALGVTAEEAERLGDVATEVFANNFGESITDAAAGLITVRQQMQGLDPSQLQTATEAAFNLQSAFGVDLTESTNAANTLMSQFGLNSQQAFDFLAQGFQSGLNNSGDFLDTIGEYSNQFSEAGFDAGAFFSTIESGLQGGVLGTDKAADAMKEFRIRIMEGSDDAVNALLGMGINADALLTGLEDGTISVADAFGIVQEGLKNTDNAVYQNTYGVALFGTQWEDLGASAVLGLDAATTSLEDMAGASAEAGNQGETFSSRFEAAQRRLSVALLPVGEELLRVAERYMPMVEEALKSLAPWIEENLPRAIEGLMAWWTDLNEGIWVVQQALDQVRQAVQPVIDAFAGFGDSLGGLWDKLPDWLTPGSPTPLEIGILGVDRAAEQLAGQGLPALGSGFDLTAPQLPALGGSGGAAAGGVTVINISVPVAGTVVSERDLIETIRQRLIDLGRNNNGTGIP